MITNHANDNAPRRCEKLPFTNRVERAMLIVAYLIQIEGDMHLPLYGELEKALSDLRSNEDLRERALGRLNAFVSQGSSPAALIAPTTSAA